jgi:CsoR family transcriptional regulator, copper-sensing transcriptional repressor
LPWRSLRCRAKLIYPYWVYCAVMDTKRGYSIEKDRLLQRLARIKGQVEGIAGMVEEDRYCIDVVTQIGAVQGALDKIALGLLDDHARHCLLGEGEAPGDPEAQADELMGAVGRLLSR